MRLPCIRIDDVSGPPLIAALCALGYRHPYVYRQEAALIWSSSQQPLARPYLWLCDKPEVIRYHMYFATSDPLILITDHNLTPMNSPRALLDYVRRHKLHPIQ